MLLYTIVVLNVENSNSNLNLKRKEIYWFVGTIGLFLILTLAIFGLNGFQTDSTLDINIHDTYFVIAHFHLVLLLFVLVFFTVYLVRTIKRNFKNVTANLILMIATVLLVLVLVKIIGMLDFFIGPNGNGAFVKEKNPIGNVLAPIAKLMFAFEIGLLLLLAYCGFKTGLNYNAEKENTKHNNT